MLRTIGAMAVVGVAGVGGALAAKPQWSGHWQFLYYPRSQGGATTVALTQKGSVVTGKIAWAHLSDNGYGNGICQSGIGGSLKGTARGNVLEGTIVYPRRGGHARTVVTFDASMARGGKTFDAHGVVVAGECSRSSSFIAFTGKRVR